jgi:MerR family transcriptional regulator, light-induced transcriptional regulator
MIENETYNSYFNSLIKGDKQECAAVFEEVVNRNVPVEEIYTGLFQRSLYQVGAKSNLDYSG